MLYSYKGFSDEGKRVKGTIPASSEEEAAQKLRAEGIYFESLSPFRGFSLSGLQTAQMPTEMIASFSKELASYLKSGMTIPTAVKLLAKQHEKQKRYTTFLSSISTYIEEGKSLYQALSSQTVYSLPEFYLQSLNIAGKSGKMAGVLQKMGDFFSTQSKIKRQVKNAMVYPSVIFTVAAGMTGFLIAYVVPKITKIFEDTDQALPPITQFVLSLSRFLTHHYVALLVGFVLAIFLLKLLYAKVRSYRRFVDGIMLRLPFFGTLIQNHELGRFSYILSLLLSSGVPYAQAVKLSVASFHNRYLAALFDDASQKVMEGNKLSNALQVLSGGKKLKRNFLQSLALGEESSEVEEVLANVSNYYAEENEERIKLLLSLMEPMMMLFVGIIVGIVVAAMLLPIFTMTRGLST